MFYEPTHFHLTGVMHTLNDLNNFSLINIRIKKRRKNQNSVKRTELGLPSFRLTTSASPPVF